MTSHDPDDDDEDSPNASGSRTNGAGSSSLVDPGPHAPARDAPPPAILELVASCVRFVLAKYRVELDGTPDTLGILDHYVLLAGHSQAHDGRYVKGSASHSGLQP